MAKMAESKEVGCQCWEAQNWEQYVNDLNDVFFLSVHHMIPKKSM